MVKYILFILTVFCVTILVSGCAKMQKGAPENINKPYISIANTYVEVELAQTVEEQRRGLMGRESLGEKIGMFFLYDSPQYLSFWMKNMKISIDIIYIDENFTIVDIYESVPPCTSVPCESYTTQIPAQYVLEVQDGFVNKHNVKIGQKITFYNS